jgi:hypothetical protein
MDLVRVSFTGRCREPKARLKLLTYLRRLAERSQRYLLAAGGGSSIEMIDRRRTGKILVADSVASDARVFTDQAKDAGLRLVSEPDAKSATFAVLPHVRLSGLDFPLFESAGVERDQKRFNFVFLDCPDTVFLDGTLVQVGRGDQLERAEIELPADLGDWIDLLFSWVKFFHIGDFAWHRGEPLPNYAEYRAILLRLQDELGPERAEAAAFNALLATFANHAQAETNSELANN